MTDRAVYDYYVQLATFYTRLANVAAGDVENERLHTHERGLCAVMHAIYAGKALACYNKAAFWSFSLPDEGLEVDQWPC